MATFQKKTINKGQTVANRLKNARLEQSLSLNDVQTKIGVQKKYLEFLESADYDSLPGDVYVRNWLKLYGKFLNLNVSELLVDYKLEKSVGQKFVAVEERKEKKIWQFLGPQFLKKVSVAFIVLAVLSYLAWEINNIISPPKITITQPNDNTKTTASSIMVSGQTEKEIQLNINGELVLLDTDGNFSKEVNLSLGLNNLLINAKKKHSKIRVVELKVLRESTE
ncbi:helix-turn-helix domain-containing protein [Patescibacteria group bacterium]|jgi:cytoskeletal protein RodZ|nr:helix-turn-helix domain-containing protein [Patescibacteria group bacterium]